METSKKKMTAEDKMKDNLKKRIRLLENDRVKYQQAAQGQMSKQQETIGNLKKENEKLKQEVAAATGGSYDFQEQDKLANMASEVDALERKIQYEKLRKNDIAKKRTMAKMDLDKTRKLRKDIGGVYTTEKNTKLIENQVKVLENRLDQALVKFNEALAFNKELREQIDNLREERKVFQRLYKKLEGELHEKKKAMAEKIERANQDYEERDNLTQQLESLRMAAKEDQKRYEENFAQIEAAMQQFKNTRDQQLAAQEVNRQKSPVKERGQEPGFHSAKEGGTTSQSKKGLSHTQSLSDTKHETEPDEEEQDLQEVVDQLKEATGIQDLDVLYHKFVKAEEHNFSMYNFVNELNSEQEMLEKDISQLKETLATEKGDAQRRKILKDLENELARTEQQYERLQSETHHHKENLTVIRTVSQEVFNRIGCSPNVARELTGSAECTELNLLTFLGMIEHRTNEILLAFNNAAANEQRRKAQSKDEESRKRKERKAAERQARMEAGEQVEDEEEEEPEEQPAAATDLEPNQKSKFIGVGPSVAHATINAQQLVRQLGLPNTNAGDQQVDATDEVDEDNILSHEALRQQMEQRLQQKREKDERGGRGKRKDRDRTKKP